MTEVADLSVKRAEKETDNRNISVEQSLRWALGDVIAGTVGKDGGRVDACVLVLRVAQPNGTFTNVTYRSNLNRMEELGLLETAKFDALERGKL